MQGVLSNHAAATLGTHLPTNPWSNHSANPSVELPVKIFAHSFVHPTVDRQSNPMTNVVNHWGSNPNPQVGGTYRQFRQHQHQHQWSGNASHHSTFLSQRSNINVPNPRFGHGQSPPSPRPRHPWIHMLGPRCGEVVEEFCHFQKHQEQFCPSGYWWPPLSSLEPSKP